MNKLTLPLRMISSQEVLDYAVDKLGLTYMQVIGGPHTQFLYVNREEEVYVKNNSVEFGISDFPFIEQRDFLKLEKDNTYVTGMYIAMNPKEEGEGTTKIFKITKVTYNYIYDSDDRSHFIPGCRITILDKNQVKILRDMKVIR